MSDPRSVMSHEDRLILASKPFPVVRVLQRSYPWGGTIVNDYFGEDRDVWVDDGATVYHGLHAQALRESQMLGLNDAVEVRQSVESQTRSRRKGHWQSR